MGRKPKPAAPAGEPEVVTPPPVESATPVTADAPPIEQQSKSNEEILADLMGGYSAPLEEVAATPDAPATETAPPADDDKSDPDKYYQTGKKKGQPRPRRGVKLEVNSNDPDTINFSDVLNGALFVSLIDMLLPLLIEVINNRLTKNKIKASDLEMTADQRKRLAPLADAVVKRFNIQAHPAWLLLFGMAGVYGMNYAAAVSASKKPDVVK